MWIGTQNGLNRYDGQQIRQYLHQPNDSFSIPGNVVYWIYKDVQGELWFVFGGGKGLAKYNYGKDRFERFNPFDNIVKKHNYSIKLWRIGDDQEGRIYFANGSSCFRYSIPDKKMEDLTPLFKGGLEGHDIGMFVQQKEHLLWITTNNGLFRYNTENDQMQHFPFDAQKFGFGDPNMHDAEFVDDHTLLVAVSRSGFVLFDTRTSTYRLPPAPIDPTHNKLFSGTGGVLKNKQGRIWMANSRYGLLEYLPSNHTIFSMKKESSYPYPYPEQEGEGLNVYEDAEGVIWYGSSRKGVIWFQPQSDFIRVFGRDFSTNQSLPNEFISGFLPLTKDKVLIATNGGLVAYTKSANSFSRFPVSFNDHERYPNPSIRGMYNAGDAVLLTTGRGLSIYNKRSGFFSRFLDTSALFNSFFPYGQWLLQQISPTGFLITGNQIAYFNVASHTFTYSNVSQPDDLFNFTDINASWYDAQKKVLWVESEVGKLYSYDVKTKTKKAHVYTRDSVQMIHAIVPDEAGKLLLGTSDGLYYYDPLTGAGRQIELGDGDTYITNIVIQNSDYIWISTQKDVLRYARQTGKVDRLSLQKLIPNSTVSPRAFLLDDMGILWVGTNNGFCTIQTQRFVGDTKMQSPALVRFSVFDKERTFDEPMHELDRITLRHDENFFSFTISAFNYFEKDQFSYKLDGFDKDWQVAVSNVASYTNVPPGDYQIHIRSKSESGTWVENKNPITLIILPAFWQTGWFLALIAAAILVLLFFIYQVVKKRRTKRQMDSTIDYFANSLYGENSVSEICWDIARNCISQLKLEDCVVYLLDEKKNVLVQKAAYGPKNPKDHQIINPIEIEVGQGIVGTAAQSAKPVLVKNTSKDHRYILDDAHRLSELAVPIIHEGKTIGVIDSEHSRKNFFTPHHVKALSTIAAISASKIAETNAEELAKQSEMQLLEIKKLLAESQLMALRAQMNPHFVFNCLNSIQECIVTQKYGDASMYLNKFSKLFRSVLNNSSRVMISLADEIEVLELYLSLEHMRFEKSFDYGIEVEEDMEVDEILVPSMLLQPYVENALWHGLMHKGSDRKLFIRFKKLNEDVFQCVVEDNGIGRKKALQVKEQQNNTRRHVSRGMTISKERVDLLQLQGQHASLQIIDKYNDEDEPTGTKVIVELSTYLKP
jgi:LytS/YehU family sensor histidine kinase/ligand-binding sensor domain-containing protein